MPSFRNALSILLFYPAIISAVSLDCNHIRAQETSYNLQKLGGPKSVHWQRKEVDFLINTTFTVDICQPLKKEKGVPTDHQCSSGTRICGVEYDHDSESKDWKVREVIQVAGEYELSNGGHLDPHVTPLKNSESSSDAEKEGIRIELNGGNRNGVNQRAYIEFFCDPNVQGTEGFEDSEKMLDVNGYGRMEPRMTGLKAREEGTGEDGDEDEDMPSLDEGKALQFVSYKNEGDKDVLRLKWNTKYACEGAINEPDEDGKKGGWGFFTWVLIIVFLLAAAYIIFGSWLNYNRYGARGWDLIPHGDTIRDLPYIAKDIGSGLMDKLRGSGSRGGYSAV